LLARVNGTITTIAAAAVALAGAALFTLTAYQVSPMLFPALLAAGTLVVLTFVRPVYGMAGALLATAFDAYRLELPLQGLPIGSLSPAEAAMALVAAGWVVRALVRPESIAKPAFRDIPVAILLLALALGVFQTDEPASVLRVTVAWTLAYLVYLQAQSLEPGEVRLVIIAFGVAAGVLGAIGTWRYVQTGDPLITPGGRLISGERAVGAFDDPNYYASLLSLALLPTIALLVHDFRRYIWLAVPAALTLGGLVFSLSRGAILGVAFGMLLLLTWRRARRVALVGALVVTSLTLAGGNSLVDTDYFGSVEERLSSLRNPTRESRRPDIWSAAVDATVQRPFFGIGVNQFQQAATERSLFEYGYPLENAHSIFLSLAAETGLIGLAAFLAFVAAIGVRALGARASPGLGPSLSLGLSAALFAFLVQGLTVTQIRVSILVTIFFMYAGMITGLYDQTRQPRGERSNSRPGPSSAGAGAA
jgi:O-antigen ligase